MSAWSWVKGAAKTAVSNLPAVKGATTAYDAVKGGGAKYIPGVGNPMTSGPAAQGGTFTPEDYLYGGGGGASAATARAQNLGESTASGFSDIGSRTQGTGEAIGQALVDQGYDARKTAMNVGDDITAGAKVAFRRGNELSVLGVGNQIDAQNAVANRLASYDAPGVDPSTAGAWNRATANVADFTYQPEAAAAAANARLSGFTPGTQGNEAANTYDALMGFANRGPGPSAAEAQLRAGADQNIAAQAALARSGRGAGESAQAARQAAFQAADIGQQTNAAAASLRAQEEASWRQQQIQALNAAVNAGTATEAQRQSLEGLKLQAATAGSQLLGSQGIAANQLTLDALKAAAGQYGEAAKVTTGANLTGGQLGLAALEGAGQQFSSINNYALGADVARENVAQGWVNQGLSGLAAGANQSNAADQLYLGSLSTAGQLYNQTYQGQLAAEQAAAAGQLAYENAALGVNESEAERRARLAVARMGGTTSASVANTEADQARDAGALAFWGNALGMAGKAL